MEITLAYIFGQKKTPIPIIVFGKGKEITKQGKNIFLHEAQAVKNGGR